MNELTVTDRARGILKFDERKAQLADLAKGSVRIVEITNTAGYQECHAARMALKTTRIDIEKAGKEAREDATKFSKAVITAENELVAIISTEEARLAALQKTWDDAREAERMAKVRAEEERLAAIERERAAAERAEQERIQREREEALAAERAELDRQRKELEAKETAQREQIRLEREAHEAKLVEERARMQAEREELERQQTEARRVAREEEDRRATVERKRLDDEAKAQREQHEREQREAAQKRLDTLKANAPALRVAAIAAHRLLTTNGFTDEAETIQLGFAIEKDAQSGKTKKAA